MTSLPDPALFREALPFPRELLKTDPSQVEAVLAGLQPKDQARCLLQFKGRERQDVLVLCRNAVEVMRCLPAEEVYLCVKEIGGTDALPMVSAMTQEQLQFMFDIEWWVGDKFVPDRALQWFELADKANDGHILSWFQQEDFEQKLMALQAWVKVVKQDEMTEQIEIKEDWPHWTPDGVYHLFFRLKDAEPVLKRVFYKMYEQDQTLFRALMEGVIWDPVTPTVERAYHQRLVRTSEFGIPNWEEARQVYSRLDPEILRQPPPDPSTFIESETLGAVAPRFPLFETSAGSFLGKCLASVESMERVDALCWEILILVNKILVADRQDLGDLECRRETLRKTLGYLNIGLQLGAGSETSRGAGLLNQTWAQSLFQVGYAACMKLKWDAEKLIREEGDLLPIGLNPAELDHLQALTEEFPRIGMVDPEPGQEVPEIQWRHLQSIEDLERLESFLGRCRFDVRFIKMVLGLSASEIKAHSQTARFPKQESDLDVMTLLVTALGHYAVYGQVACEPLPEEAAQSFLQVIFLPNPLPDEPPTVDSDILETFRTRLLERPLAWSEEDRHRFETMMISLVTVLTEQFGRLNLKKPVKWHFTHGLWVK